LSDLLITGVRVSEMLVDLPAATYTAGRYESVSRVAVGDYYGSVIALDIQAHTNPAIEIVVERFVSTDGLSWVYAGGFKRVGGEAFVRDSQGNPIEKMTHASFSISHCIPTYAQNGSFSGYTPRFVSPLIKTVLSVTGGSVVTEVATIEKKTPSQQVNVPDIHHSIAYVQGDVTYGSSVASVTTSGLNTTNGNLVVHNQRMTTFSGNTGLTASDSNSNTWTQSIALFNLASIWYHREDYNASITGGSGHTFTTTRIGSANADNIGVAVAEISGHDATPLDATATGSGNQNNGDTFQTALTATTSQAAELLITAGSTSNPGTISLGGTGWTQIDFDTNLILGYKIVSATAQYRGEFTTGTNDIFTCTISTWKEGAAAGDAVPQAWAQYRARRVH
jgi:hypothetical protein